MITDKQVQRVIREAATSDKRSVELRDPGERGAGRLAMVVRPSGAGRVMAEWYAVYFIGGGRRKALSTHRGFDHTSETGTVVGSGGISLLDLIGQRSKIWGRGD